MDETRSRKRVGLLEQARRVPVWGKVFLAVAVLLAVGGAVGLAVNGAAAVERKEAAGGVNVPANARGFAPSSSDEAPGAKDQSVDLGPLGKYSPEATRLGVSVVGGFVVGWLFRAFLKMAMLLALLGVGVMVALSYFGVMNVDLSAAREHYASAAHWLTDQAGRMKDVVLAHLPSGGGGAVGAWLGFRRR